MIDLGRISEQTLGIPEGVVLELNKEPYEP
jgi:hypothetical protein